MRVVFEDRFLHHSYGDGAVSSASYGDGAVSSTSCGDGAVSSISYGDGAVSSTSCGDGEVSSTSYGDGAVSSASYGDGAVSSTSYGVGVKFSLLRSGKSCTLRRRDFIWNGIVITGSVEERSVEPYVRGETAKSPNMQGDDGKCFTNGVDTER